MIALDTNAVLRLLLGDIPAQQKEVEVLIARLAAKNDTAFIGVPVLLEVTFVLKKKRTKEEIINAIDGLLTIDVFTVDHSAEVREALEVWRRKPAGFNDLLIGTLGRAAGCAKGATFDQNLQKSDPFFVAPNAIL